MQTVLLLSISLFYCDLLSPLIMPVLCRVISMTLFRKFNRTVRMK